METPTSPPSRKCCGSACLRDLVDRFGLKPAGGRSDHAIQAAINHLVKLPNETGNCRFRQFQQTPFPKLPDPKPLVLWCLCCSQAVPAVSNNRERGRGRLYVGGMAGMTPYRPSHAYSFQSLSTLRNKLPELPVVPLNPTNAGGSPRQFACEETAARLRNLPSPAVPPSPASSPTKKHHRPPMPHRQTLPLGEAAASCLAIPPGISYRAHAGLWRGLPPAFPHFKLSLMIRLPGGGHASNYDW